jgi:hypothetical protein
MNGVTFGTKHSYMDFGLILTSKSIPLPEPKTSLVDIPGADGSLDMSTVLTNGEVKYDNRKLQFVFTVIEPNQNWESAKSNFANFLHGQRMNIILDADKDFYYVGRCRINTFGEDKRTAQIIVDADAEPYKYDVLESIYNFTIEEELTAVIPNKRMQVVPTIICSGAMDVVFNGVIYGLAAGTNMNLNINFKEGDNTIKFIGNGTVVIKFRGGSL